MILSKKPSNIDRPDVDKPDVDMPDVEKPQTFDLESQGIRAFPKSAESSWLNDTPFPPIPITPAIMRHEAPTEAAPSRQEGHDEDLTHPMQLIHLGARHLGH